MGMLEASDGPQIGMYSFDYHGKMWPDGDLKLWINNVCVGEASGSCTSGDGESPRTPEPPSSTIAPLPVPEPEPEPTDETSPEPEPETLSCESLRTRRNLTYA